MNKELLDIYSGDQPYVFVSYSHRDEAVVFPLVRTMQERGYRIWLDRGIEVGTEWSNNIADRLRRCEAVIFFVSKNSVASENCLDEVSFAKSHKKPAILIFLEDDVAMPEGMEMQTARFQRMYLSRHTDVDSVARALDSASILSPCRPAPASAPAVESTPASTPAPVHVPTPTPAPVGGAVKQRPSPIKVIVGIIAALLALGLLGVIVAGIPTDNDTKKADSAPYSADALKSAFESAGYETEITTDELNWEYSEYPAMEEHSSFTAVRTDKDGNTDYVMCVYVSSSHESYVEKFYNDVVAELSGPSQVRTYLDYQRAVYTDSTYGECQMVSLNGDVVVLTYVDYSDYVDYDVAYDHKPEDVLRGANL